MALRNSLVAAWQSADHAHLVRIVAAAALLFAGWSFGFFSGRMSAWIFPVDSRASRVAAEKVPGPPPQAAQSGQPARHAADTASPPPKSPPAETSIFRTNDSAELQATEDGVKNAPPDPASVQGKLERPDLALRGSDPIVRPDEGDEVEKAQEPPRGRGTSAGYQECERRFSSFRRSDGTYQPFGSRSRAVCPYLGLRQ